MQECCPVNRKEQGRVHCHEPIGRILGEASVENDKNMRPVGGLPIGDEITNNILRMVCTPDSLPLCAKEPAATHAAGDLVTLSAAKTLLENISYLADQIDVAIGEVEREADLTPEALLIHFAIVDAVYTNLAFAVASRNPDDPGQNISVEIMKKLPEHFRERYSEDIFNAWVALNTLVDEMDGLLSNVIARPRARWSTEIDSTLKGRLLHQLSVIYDLLTAAAGRLKRVLNDDLTQDFQTAVETIRKNRTCWPPPND
jgi:hypothetical protein